VKSSALFPQVAALQRLFAGAPRKKSSDNRLRISPVNQTPPPIKQTRFVALLVNAACFFLPLPTIRPLPVVPST